jgi:CelD/BcsL family acetyltransferase involved in cellulose biosynthesis
MPTARELLEQADALMRRNRSPLMDDIPVLTDSVPALSLRRPPRSRPEPPADDVPDSIPTLEERVVAPAPVAEGKRAPVVEEGEPSDWLQLGGAEPSVIGEAPDSIAIVPDVVLPARDEVIEVEAPAEVEEAFDLELAQAASPPEPLAAPLAATAAQDAPLAATAAPDDARWAAMAEEIRMQVLQRIDLFTDAGLRDQLGERLQPIVDRASADLVATINQHVGELLRAYVAEAIEREIDNWKRNN